MNNVFRIMILTYTVIYFLWLFLPYSYGYWVSEKSLVMLEYNGLDSMVDLSVELYWVVGLVTILTNIGVYYYKYIFRNLFFVLVIVNAVLNLALGLAVYTAFELLLIYLMNILTGGILVLMYGTRLSDKFINKQEVK